MKDHDAVITGIGIVSCLGVGKDAHLAALTAGRPAPVLDSERFAPITVHPLPEIDWNLQIPKRGDQRQMEQWQRLGVYTAGIALDDAGVKGDGALCTMMELIVAAGGGERDEAVDAGILEAALTRDDEAVLLNEKLTTELRPTLFLAQLSNLLAGNISIVHKVTGSSRTFMGEEGAGISAIETAVARVRSGQSTHVLVGGAFQTEHPDHLLSYALGGMLQDGGWTPVWSRNGPGGIVTGSGAAFLVIEARAHAAARGRAAYATIAGVHSSGASRDGADLAAVIGAAIDAAGGRDADLVVSGASGAPGPTRAEQKALGDRGLAARGFCSLTGHTKEAQFPLAVALAALAVANGAPFPAFDAATERPAHAAARVLATTVGMRRGEGAALLTAP